MFHACNVTEIKALLENPKDVVPSATRLTGLVDGKLGMFAIRTREARNKKMNYTSTMKLILIFRSCAIVQVERHRLRVGRLRSQTRFS